MLDFCSSWQFGHLMFPINWKHCGIWVPLVSTYTNHKFDVRVQGGQVKKYLMYILLFILKTTCAQQHGYIWWQSHDYLM